ncbi:VOC family protein [Denitromonas iodatirespirans]|uniref:VOC family protein n=1 Tax=Denitromonas iodatirespirans TaxID=2795389 RepID=A0A944D7T7_DENI1|nr:VOC family protein [Denitromonas iodatirespirans]MBT0960106.1 VOC family protein [Denitromonas iodatirespirans]
MKILGPDLLVFGVDHVPACCEFLIEYGLTPVGVTDQGGRFEAMDGTGVLILSSDDPSLPPALSSGNTIRETIYGVQDAQTLEAVGRELSKDREVRRAADGSLHCTDDLGFAIAFQVTVRKPYAAAATLTNAPGSPPQRGPNQVAVDPDAQIRPRTLSHVVFFVPDAARMEAFYHRLGFRVTDRFTGTGAFMRPEGNADHHALFFIQTPPFMQGCEHFAFHLGGPSDVIQAGSRLVAKGYQSYWGPGRHIFGSNWFWYFNSPMGVHVEYDADMDLHDDAWTPREATIGADASQLFLMQHREKWSPGGPPPA